MTLTIELTQEQERKLQADAARTGLPLPEYALRRLVGGSPKIAPAKRTRKPTTARVSVMGKYADVPTSSEAFAARKAAQKSAAVRVSVVGKYRHSPIGSEEFVRERHEEAVREEGRSESHQDPPA